MFITLFGHMVLCDIGYEGSCVWSSAYLECLSESDTEHFSQRCNGTIDEQGQCFCTFLSTLQCSTHQIALPMAPNL
jgi:hypothetical protein